MTTETEYIKKLYTASLFPSDRNIFDLLAVNTKRIAKTLDQNGITTFKSCMQQILIDVQSYYEESPLFEFRDVLEKINVEEEQEEDRPKNCEKGKLRWFSNSCWLDSTLYAMMYIPNKFVIENILEKDLNSKSYNPPQCTTGEKKRKAIYRNEQNEVVEIVEYEEEEDAKYKQLEKEKKLTTSIDPVYKSLPKKMRKYASSIQIALVNIYTSIHTGKSVFCTDLRKLLISPECNIPQFSEQMADVYTAVQYLKGILSIFDIEDRMSYYDSRIYEDYFILNIEDQKFKFPEIEMTFPGTGNKAILFAIVIKAEGHYVSAVMCDDIWYYYNDLRFESNPERKLPVIGNFEELMKYKFYRKSTIQKNANLLFYSDKSYFL